MTEGAHTPAEVQNFAFVSSESGGLNYERYPVGNYNSSI